MSTNENSNSSLVTEDQLHANSQETAELILTSFTYAQLGEFHIERRAVDKNGNKRPKQSLDNERSVVEDWLSHHGLSRSANVGEELGVRFVGCLDDYTTALKDRNLAKQTVLDRQTILRMLRRSYFQLQLTSGLPEDFHGALKELVKASGTSVPELARKAGISADALRSWMDAANRPSPKALSRVRKLERALKVLQGTLSSRMPEAYWSKRLRRTCATKWRSHLSTLLRLRYRLSVFPPRLQEECDELVLVFTDSQAAVERGLNITSEWRIRWNTKMCPTAEFFLSGLKSFFGFLCLPVTASDKRMAGLGFSKEDLSLAYLTDADLVIKYLYFKKGRTLSDSFNTGTTYFLAMCKMLLSSETGYLRQCHEFGSKLLKPIAESDWAKWCEDNLLKLLQFSERISPKQKGKKGKNGKRAQKDRVRRTRDPFEPVREIIEERQHPITALFDLIDRLESVSPVLERGCKTALAVHKRSIFQISLLSSNPLRVENFSMMTHIPKDYDSLSRECQRYRRCKAERRKPDLSELYVETTRESNLYQKRDGSWWLRFDEQDFKNEKGEDIERGVLPTPYDVEIVPSVWPALAEYIFIHRGVIIEALREDIRKTYARRGLPELTPEEDLAILRCPYVFRPSGAGLHSVPTEKLLAGYGTAQMATRALSDQVLNLTTQYLPESKGFCAHACRHLVATEYIKNYPNGWDVAAAALHNTAAMVRKHYAWVKANDLIKPWSDHHEAIRAKHYKGEL
jgi:ribosome-binding protein aMBF1 (putative translation factor)